MPSMREFCRICEYLDITPEEFFMGSSGPSVKTSMVIFFFVNKIIFPEGQQKKD